MSNLIQRLVIDHIHIVGDIYDRGPGPHIIMDRLMQYHSVDIQWGNHDVTWMGAAAGHQASIANDPDCGQIREPDMLEEGYGINLIPLANLAMNTYRDDKCSCFKINYNADEYNTKDLEWDRRIQKAIAVIQFKLEGQIIRRRPEFGMEDRLMLDKMDLERGTILVEGEEYPLRIPISPPLTPQTPMPSLWRRKR